MVPALLLTMRVNLMVCLLKSPWRFAFLILLGALMMKALSLWISLLMAAIQQILTLFQVCRVLPWVIHQPLVLLILLPLAGGVSKSSLESFKMPQGITPTVVSSEECSCSSRLVHPLGPRQAGAPLLYLLCLRPNSINSIMDQQPPLCLLGQTSHKGTIP